MRLSELAQKLSDRVHNVLNAGNLSMPRNWAKEILTQKEMSEYGRTLEPGCIALRVYIVANEDMGDMGKMELFVPVSKKQLKRDPDMVLAAVLRYIMASAQYRADTLARVRERVGEAAV